MPIIDKIQLSGTVYTIGSETTTAVTSASTDNEIPTAKAVYDAIPQGGGKAVTGGTNINVTTGETADTINCTLPITATTGSSNIELAIGENATAQASYNSEHNGGIAIGYNTYAKNEDIAIGGFARNRGNWNDNVLIGFNTSGYSQSVCIGSFSKGYNGYKAGTVSLGYLAQAANMKNAVAIGHEVSTTGTTKTNINNQLTIDTSNQVYIYNKDNTEMICLQDQLGGGASYTAGDGIDITNDVISVTGKVDTTAFTAHTADTVIHVTSAEKATWNAKSDFSGDYNDLTNKPTIPTVPTSNTAFTNDAGYITSDAISGKVDTSTYNTYTAATDTALATKQDTLVSGTNIKTINNESILGSGNITIEGGSSVNVVQTTGTSTADVMSQDAVTTKFKTKLNNVGVQHQPSTSNYSQLNLYLNKEGAVSQSLFTYVKTINGKSITSQSKDNLEGLSLIETSAITTSVTSASTDTQVPSAKAVNDKLGGLKLVKLTQSEYDALATKDSNTLYIING